MNKMVMVTAMAMSTLIACASGAQARGYNRAYETHGPIVSWGVISFVVGFIVGYAADSIAYEHQDKVGKPPEVTQDR